MAGFKFETSEAGASSDEPESPSERELATMPPFPDEQKRDTDTEWQKFMSTCYQLPSSDYPQEGHTGHVYAIQLSEKWLVSGGADKTIRVWDLETRRLRGTPLVGHSQSVLCLQFDPGEEEDVIISGSADASVIVWRFSTGQPLKIITGAHQESILDLQFNRTRLFTASKDKTVKIWNRHKLSPLDREYPRFRNSPETIIPDYVVDLSSTELALIEAGLANGSIQTLEPYTHVATLQGHRAAVNAIDVCENLLLSGSGDGSIRVWDLQTGQCTSMLSGTRRGRACIQSNGKHIISGGSDNSIRIDDVETGDEIAVLLEHSYIVRCLQVDFDGFLNSVFDEPVQARQKFEDGNDWNRIVSGSYDESIIFWKKDTQGNWSVEHTLSLKDIVTSFSNTDQAAQASSTDPRRLSEYDWSRPEQSLRVFKVRFNARRMVCASQDSCLYCWEIAGG